MRNKGLFIALSVFAAALLSGCSANFQPSPIADTDSSQTPIGDLNGSVYGGNFPVTGAQIYLFATGTGGTGTASTSLITSGKTGVTCNGATVTLNGKTVSALSRACYVTTNLQGNFALSGDYSCTAGQQVYMVAVGGNPGLTGTVNNTHLVQMVGLGQCPSAGNLAAQDPFIDIDEITTVAFAYSMAGFGSDAFDIATDATTAGANAIAIAMANSQNVVDTQRGTIPTWQLTHGSSGWNPASKMTALADILATCVNTTGSINTGTNNGNRANFQPCYYLMEYAGATFTGNGTGEATTSDESQAIFYIAHNPTSNVTNIFNLLPATPVWATNLTTPSDWTLPVVFKNVVSSRPGNIAFDSNGNAWVSDRNNDAVVKVSPVGVVSKFTNLNNGSSNGSIYQVAVDSGNNVWALDYTYSQIYRMNPSGAWESTITGNQLSAPVAISFNSFGSAVVLNSSDNYISRFSSSGAAQSPASYNQVGQGTLGAPSSIAVDTGGNAFVPSNGGCACVGILANNASAETTYQDWSGTDASATALAMDGSNDPWQAQDNEIVENPTYSSSSYQYYDNQIFGFTVFQGYYFNATNFAFGYPFGSNNPTILTGGGLNTPVALTFDGGGNLWAANSGASTVSGFNGTTALAANGLQTGSSGVTYGVAADPAGNLWTVNSDGTITELLGAANPTSTPVYPGQIAKAP